MDLIEHDESEGIPADPGMAETGGNAELPTGEREVQFGAAVEVERVEMSPADLVEVGYQTVEDLLRAELINSQGMNGGYYTGVNAKESLNVGLTDAGRKTFRDARKKAVTDYLAGDLIGSLSQSD